MNSVKKMSEACKHKKVVINITTGEKYLSIADAAKSIGVNKRDIRKVCSSKQKTTRGYVFKFI